MIKNLYKLKISGKDFRQVINDLVRFKIYFNYSEIKEKECFIIVDDENLEKIKKLKSIYKIDIVNTYGPIKYKRLLKKYTFFLLALFIGFLLLTFLSSLIFRVEVVHSNKEIRNLVKKDLEEYNLKPYRFKVSFQAREKIVKKILEKEKERLEWLEIKESGTTYIVNVEERKKDKLKKIGDEQDIVAKKDAMILRIEASSGEIQKKKYDYVKKGDIIISGFIKNKEDVVSKVRAQGKVYGEVWYEVDVELPKNYTEKEYTNRNKNVLQLNIFSKTYNLFSSFKNYKNEDKFTIKNNILPLSLKITNLKEVKLRKEKYNINNASSKALTLATEKLEKQLQKEDTIISKKVLKKTEKKSKILVEVFFKVSEDITDSISIKNKEIPKDDKEVKEE